MKAADEFKDKTTAPNELWHDDLLGARVIALRFGRVAGSMIRVGGHGVTLLNELEAY
jgi:hypothetical protein